MQEFIDKCFSNFVFMAIFLMGQIFFFIWLAVKNPFRSPRLNTVFKAIMFITPGVIWLVPMMVDYGVTNHFQKMTIGPNHICLFEQYGHAGGKGKGIVTRLHMLNKHTGAKMKRLSIGPRGELFGQKGDLVSYAYKEGIILYDISKDEKIYSISMNDWVNEFSELKQGVQQINYQYHYNESNFPLITITGKDGNYYWFEPFEKKLQDSAPIYGCSSTGDNSKCSKKNVPSDYFLTFGSVNGSGRKNLTSNLIQKEENTETFLEPLHLGTDTLNQIFVFVHYATTDKTDFTMEAKNYSLETVWKKTKAELEVEDFYSKKINFDVHMVENGILYYNVGGFLLAMKINTGETIWKTRN